MTDHDRRSSDTQIQRLEDKVDDLLKRFEPVEKFYDQMKWPMTALGWALTVTVAGVLGAAGMAVYGWFRGHWH